MPCNSYRYFFVAFVARRERIVIFALRCAYHLVSTCLYRVIGLLAVNRGYLSLGVTGHLHLLRAIFTRRNHVLLSPPFFSPTLFSSCRDAPLALPPAHVALHGRSAL